MDRLDVLLALERWGGYLLLLSVFVAPFVLSAAAVAFARRRDGAQGTAAGLGCGASLLYTPVVFVFAVCHGAYVGEAPRARVGFRWAEPVVAALAQYRAERGRYPDSLPALVPRYLRTRTALTLPGRGRFSGGPRYAREGGGYTLSFEYHGPGVNECRYTSDARRWSCGGYF